MNRQVKWEDTMNERDLQVLEQYLFNVKGSRRTRGAFLLDTDEGKYVIREFLGSSYKLQREQELLEYLRKQGFSVDLMKADKEGQLATTYREYYHYVVKESLNGRECDIRSESELLKAASLLAGMHQKMRGIFPIEKEDKVRLLAPHAVEEMKRHNRELRKIYAFIQKKNRKNEFEAAYLSCFSQIIKEAQEVEYRLQQSAYEDLRARAIQEGHLCHGEYMYHNILVDEGQMSVINFEKFTLDLQVNDLYLFLRKVLEKQNYDFLLGRSILKAYEDVCPLSKEEKEYLSIRLAYPEKFWKLANYYYNSNKAWIPGKHMEKLEKFLVQKEKRVSFSMQILYNDIS